MRILHTADWHLGRTLHGCSLLEDQAHALEQVKAELTQGYDALLIAGDIYDRAIPPPEAVELFGAFLNWAAEHGIKVIIIPGNHDSPQRLGFADRALDESGVSIRWDYHRLPEPIVLQGKDGQTVDVFALPFVEAAYLREQLALEDMTDHTAATAAALEQIRSARRDGVASLLVAHAFVGQDSQTSESERELIGGSQRLDAALFAGFDYVALGHLHRPQAVNAPGMIRYSGSLLPYSFSECDHDKVIVRLELNAQTIHATPVVLKPKRKLRVLQDSLERLLTDPRYEEARQGYVSARLTDTGYLLNIYARLKERFPLLLEIRQPGLENAAAVEKLQLQRASTREELFGAFLDYFGWKEQAERIEAVKLLNETSARVEAKRREANA